MCVCVYSDGAASELARRTQSCGLLEGFREPQGVFVVLLGRLARALRSSRDRRSLHVSRLMRSRASKDPHGSGSLSARITRISRPSTEA